MSADRVLACVSGGGDSVALAYALRHFSDELGYAVEWAHYNFRLRGEESDAEEAYVRELAERWDHRLHTASPGPEELKCLRLSRSEVMARDLRYGFFRTIMDREGMNRLAVGHTRDDQAETMIMRIIRGTSLTGLGGMKSMTEDGIIRPLLAMTRDEVREFLSVEGIRYMHDSSNDSVYYFRNRVRKTILPLLRTENPAVVDSLYRMGKTVQQVEDLLACMVREREREILVERMDSGIILDYAGFMKLPVEIRNRIIIGNWHKISGDPDDKHIQFKHVSMVNAMLESGDSRCWSVSLPSGIRARREGGRFCMNRAGTPVSVYSVPLSVPGSTRVPGFSGVIHARWTGADEPACDPDGLFSFICFLDSETGSRDLVVRSRQPHDWIRPIHGLGKRKLTRFFNDRHIPSSARGHHILVADGDEILWIVGLEQSATGFPGNVGPGSGRVLELRWIESPPDHG